MGEHLYSCRRLGGAVSRTATELNDVTVAATGAAATAAAGGFTTQRAQTETWVKQGCHVVTSGQNTRLHSQLLVTVLM